MPFGRLFLNSLIVTVVGAGLKVVLAVLTAYALVFVRFPGKRIIFALILATLMVPPQVQVLPNYVFISGPGRPGHLLGDHPARPGDRPSARSCCASSS